MCKGSRALCGRVSCPLLSRISIQPRMNETLEKDFFGPSPSIFVGRYGYPNVNVGPLAAIEMRENIDSPANWLSMKYSDIIELRSMLLRSKMPQNVKSDSRFALENQELALADRPTDVELSFKSKPVYRVSFSDVNQPMGPSASLERLTLAENTHIPKSIESVVSDEVKASEAGVMLFQGGQDVYKISTILSSGAIGLKPKRKMVPTRWSITAVDSLLFDYIIDEVKQLPSVNEFMVFSHKALDNRFEILLMPGSWEYENFESWAPGSLWTEGVKKTQILEEYEPFAGRTTYAEKEAGGYYAARFAVTEALHRMRRQARVVVFREVYEGYQIPLGVWQVRENVREAMRSQPQSFPTVKEALLAISGRLRIRMHEYLKESRVLGQKRLTDF